MKVILIFAWPTLAQSVKLDYGTFQGLVSATTISYLGIPFAEPPVGALRFKSPKPIAKKSDEIVNASEFGPACLQSGTQKSQSEDCLNLNVFAPLNATGLPVLVWVFGGGFTDGSNSMDLYDGRNILTRSPKFVVVSINYRLNSFGFLPGKPLASENGVVNPGLMDQKLAFEWVRQNIQKFGGDPSRITAVGESAGAISIAIHMLAEGGSQKLFDRAILLSGAAPIYSDTPASSEVSYQKILSAVGCSNASDSLQCLRAVDGNTLLANITTIELQFTPLMDGAYFESQPIVSFLEKKTFSQIPVLLQTNRDEGTLFGLRKNLKDQTEVRAAIHEAAFFFSETDLDQLDKYYQVDSYTPETFGPQLAYSDFFGDTVFQCPAQLMSSVYTQAGQAVYNARNNHANVYSFYPKNIPLGIYHGSELQHFFQFKPLIAANETDFSFFLHDSYMNFAAGQAPSGTWPTYGPGNRRFNIEEKTIDADVDRNAKCSFFVDVVSKLFLKSTTSSTTSSTTTTAVVTKSYVSTSTYASSCTAIITLPYGTSASSTEEPIYSGATTNSFSFVIFAVMIGLVSS